MRATFWSLSIGRHNRPYRWARRYAANRTPSGNPVVFACFHNSPVFKGHVRNSLPGARQRLTNIIHPTDANHVTALLVKRIRVEQIVADIFQYQLDLFACHVADVSFWIGDAGLVQYTLHCHGITRKHARPPPETRRKGDLGYRPRFFGRRK